MSEDKTPDQKELVAIRDAQYGKKALAWSVSFLLVWEPALVAAATTTSIVPKDSPSTVITESGSVTDISGGKVSGDSQIHKYSEFDVGAGDTVNLQFNNDSNNVINLVYDKESFLDGTLNGIKNGAIGGHVYFLNSNGVVMGSGGVINAGTLTMATPTTAAMDDIWDDVSNTAKLSDYSIDLSEGEIDINGQINAAGDIHVLSKTININSGAGLYSGGVFDDQGDILAQALFTQVVNTNGAVAGDAMVLDDAGNINIVARDSATKTDFSKVTSAATIAVTEATLKGGNIAISAEATASTEYDDSVGGAATATVDALGGLLAGVDAVVGEVKSTAEVVVTDATLVAAENITVDAASFADVKATGLALEMTSAQQTITTAVGYGNVESTATAKVSGGTVKAGDDVKVEATNEAALSLSTYAVGQQSKSIDAVSIGEMTVNSTALLDSDVTADKVDVIARNWNQSVVTATASRAAPADDGSTAPVGIAVAVSVNETHADADLAGTVTINDDASAGGVGVIAEDNVVQDRTAAGTSASKISGLVYNGIVSGTTSLGSKLSGLVGGKASTSAKVADSGSSNTQWTVGAATAVALHNQSATAAAAASTKQTDTADKSKFGGSAAVVVGIYDQDALATVGEDAELNTDKLAVNSETRQTYEFNWDPWGAFVDILAAGLGDNILGSSGSDPEDVNDTDPFKGIFSTVARTSASGGELALGGTFSYVQLDTTSHATIDDNASVISSANTPAGDWGYTLEEHGQLDGRTIRAADTISVAANNTQEEVSIAGQFGYMLFGTNSGQSGSAIGAGYGQTDMLSDTRARVNEGVTISAAGSDVKVNASSTNMAIAILPGAGNGGAFAFEGNAGLVQTDADTEASVDDDASVKANSLDVLASDTKRLTGVVGTITKAEGTGVGVGVLINSLNGNTLARIGDNGDSDDGEGSGKISVSELNVNAESQAKSDAAAIAATYVSQGNGSGNGFITKMTNGVKKFMAKVPVLGKTIDTSQDQSQRKEFDASNAVAGAAAVTLTDLDVAAELVNAQVSASAIQVEALNNSELGTGAGGGALAWSSNKNQTKAAAIAGAVAVTLMDNATTANISGSTITDNNNLTVDALSGGDVTTIGLGMATELSSSNNDSSKAVGLSLSLNLLGKDLNEFPQEDGDPEAEALNDGDEGVHGTFAAINGSQVTGASDNSADVTVLAYDSTSVQAGGGSLAVSKQNSVGATAAATVSAAETEVQLNNTAFTDVNALDALALNATRIMSGAAAIAAATGEKSAGTGYGAVVVNEINNTTRVNINGSRIDDVGDHLVVLAQDSAGVNLLDNRLHDGSRSSGDVTALFDGSTEAPASDLGDDIDALADLDIGGGDGVEVMEDDSDNITTASRSYDDNDDWVDARLSELLSSDLGTQGNGNAIYTAAGGGAGSSNGTAAGISLLWNDITNTTQVDIGNSDLGSSGAESLIAARSRSRVVGAALGIAASTNASAGVGSGTASFVHNTTEVTVDRDCSGDCSGQQMSLAGSDVQVQARDRSYIASFAGQVTGSGKSNALGAAVSYNDIANTTQALVTDAEITTDGLLRVEGLNDGDIDSLAAGVGGGQGWAVGLSGSINQVSNTARGKLVDSDVSGGAELVSISATDDTDIRSLAASIQVSTQSNAGAIAASVNRTANTVEGVVDGLYSDAGITADTVLIDAVSRTDQKSLAAGVGGGNIGLAGSTATNLVDNTVLAQATDTAVSAANNIAVRADSSDRVQTASGSIGIGKDSVGVGINVGVNSLGGSTKAEVVNSTLVATGFGDGVSGQNLGSSPDNAAIDLLNYGQRDLTGERDSNTVQGVLVEANSSQLVDSIGVAVAGGDDLAAALVPIVTIMDGTTQAKLDNVDVNLDVAELGSDQTIAVHANHHAVGNSFTGQVAGSKSAAGGAAVDTRFFNRSTNALVANDSQLEAGNGVDVSAHGREEASTVVVSGAAAANTAVGSAAVNKYNSTVRAQVDGSDVHWAGDDGFNLAALQEFYGYAVGGSGGIAGNGGAALGLFVQMALGDTHAELIDSTATGDAGLVNVHAQNTLDMRSQAGAIQLSGSGSGAGFVSVLRAETEAEAEVTNSTLAGRNGYSLSDVNVTAEEDVVNQQVSAMAAAGAQAGVGAAFSVALLNNSVTATISGGSVDSDNLSVRAESRKTAQMITAGAAVGAAGISGSVGILLVGEAAIDDGSSANGESVDAGGELEGSFAEADAFMAEDMTSDNLELSDDERARFAAAQSDGELDSISAADLRSDQAIRAQVSGDAEIEAYQITVEAREKLATQNIVGNFAGGLGGLGGAIGVSKVHSDVLAAFEPEGDSLQDRSGNIQVTAQSGQFDADDDQELDFEFVNFSDNVNLRTDDDRRAADVLILSGAAGAVTLGAGVGYALLDNDIDARMGGGSALKPFQADRLSVAALDQGEATVDAYGGAVGGTAVGVMVAYGRKTSAVDGQIYSTQADVNGGALEEDEAEVSVTAATSGAVRGTTVGASGGILGVNAAVSIGEDDSNASATIVDSILYVADRGLGTVAADNTFYTSPRDARVVVTAEREPAAVAKASGVAIGGYGGVGASVASAQVNGSVNAAVDNSLIARDLTAAGWNGSDYYSGTQAGPDVSINAALNHDNPNAKAQSWAASGAGVAAANASVALSQVNVDVNAGISNGAQLRDVGNVTIQASKRGAAESDGYGISVAGGFSAGATVSKVDSKGTTRAAIGDNTLISGAADVVVTADSRMDNDVSAEAGAAAAIAGISAAVADIDEYASAQVYLGSAINAGTHTMDSLVAGAIHNSILNNDLDAFAGGIFGGSGLDVYNDVDFDVSAEVAEGAAYESESITLSATADIDKPDSDGYNLNVVGGGAFAGFLARSRTDINTDTSVTLGANAALTVIGDRDDPGAMQLTAYNDFDLHDDVKLETGAAIQATDTESRIFSDHANASVDLGTGVTLDTVGDIALEAKTDALVHSKTNSKTYGLAAGVGGVTVSKIVADNRITLAENSTDCSSNGGCTELRADGDIYLAAGTTATGVDGKFDLDATTDAYNKSAIPISVLSADASVDLSNTITVGANTSVRAVKDVNLITDRGNRALNAYWIHKYYGSKSEGGDVTESGVGGLVLDGALEAGINHQQAFHITGEYIIPDDVASDPSSLELDESVVTQTDGITFTFGTTNIGQDLADRLADLDVLIGEYSGQAEAKQAYISERVEIVNQLQALGFVEVDADGNVAIDSEKRVDTVTIDDVLAQPGNIHLIGDYAEGSGSLTAHGDASIEIINDGPRFMYLNDLSIPEESGGNIVFNYGNMADLDAINSENTSGHTADFAITHSPGGGATSIEVQNNYVSNSAGILSPQVFANGDINNVNGVVKISSADGSIFINGELSGGTVDIDSGGDVLLGYVNGFRHLGGDPREDSAVKTNLARLEALSACKNDNANCDVNGKNPFGVYSQDKAYADLSTSSGCDEDCQMNSLNNRIATIQTAIQNAADSLGTSDESGLMANGRVVISGRYVNINTTVQSGVSQWQLSLDGTDGSAIDTFQAQYDKGQTGTQYLTLAVTDAATGSLGAVYNAQTGRIEVDKGEAKGGFIEVVGRVFSTGGGQLNVVDGYSNVSVSNTTGKDIELGLLSTGRGETYGNGIEGTIRLVDSNIQVSGEPKVTEYRRVGNQWQRWEGYRAYNADTKEVDYQLTQVGTGTGRSTRYSPKANLEYSWVTGQRFTEIKDTYREDNALFGVDALWADEAWDKTTNRAVDAEALLEGEYLTQGSGGLSDYDYGFSSSSTSDYVKTYSKTEKECGFLCIKKTYKTWATYERGKKNYNTHAIEGDREVAIGFIGDDSAAVTVNTNSDAYLTGELRAENGAVKITANSLVQDGSGALLRGENVYLKTSGAIGEGASAVQMDVGEGGVYAFNNGGGIYLENQQTSARGSLSGDLAVSYLEAGSDGEVQLTAAGNITGIDSGPHIVGGEVILATSGNIGDGSDLVVKVANGLSASAEGDIRIAQLTGDLGVKNISTPADVYLTVKSGNVLDANTADTADVRSQEQLLALWGDLNLREEDGAAVVTAAATAAYVNGLEQNYAEYQGIEAQVADGAFAFTADQRDGFMAQGYSEADIASLEQARTDRYGALQSELADHMANFDDSGNYLLPSATQTAMEKGSVWTTDELTISYDRGVKGVTDTETVLEDSNISAANVVINAVTGAIGTVIASDVVVPYDVFASGDISSLSDDQKVALAAAESGDYLIDEDANTVTIVRVEDFDVTATGGITAAAAGDIYLGSETDMHVTSVSGDAVRIKGSQDLLADTGGVINPGDSLILEAANGAIGSVTARMVVNNDAAQPLTARADTGLWLAVNGDLNINNLFTNQVADLLVDGNVLDARADNSADLAASWVSIEASGDIGLADDALEVSVNALGETTDGYSAGTLVLNAGSNVFVAVTAGAVTSLSGSTYGSDGVYQVSADDGVAITQSIDAGGKVKLDMPSLTMAEGASITAGDAIAINVTDGDATLTGITSSADSTADKTIAVTVNGDLLNGDVGVSLFNLPEGAGELWLDVVGNIGSNVNPVDMAVSNLTASAGGNMYLHSRHDITVASIHAGESLVVVADGALTSGDITSGNDMTITAEDDIHFEGATLTSGDNLNLASVSGGLYGGHLIGLGDVNVAGNVVSLDSIEAGGGLGLTSAGDFDISELVITGDIDVQVGGNMAVTSAISQGDITLTVAGATVLDNASAAGNLTSVSGGNGTYGVLASSGDMSLVTGASMDIQSGTAGGVIDLNAGSDMYAGYLKTDTQFLLDAGHSLLIDMAELQQPLQPGEYLSFADSFGRLNGQLELVGNYIRLINAAGTGVDGSQANDSSQATGVQQP